MTSAADQPDRSGGHADPDGVERAEIRLSRGLVVLCAVCLVGMLALAVFAGVEPFLSGGAIADRQLNRLVGLAAGAIIGIPSLYCLVALRRVHERPLVRLEWDRPRSQLRVVRHWIFFGERVRTLDAEHIVGADYVARRITVASGYGWSGAWHSFLVLRLRDRQEVSLCSANLRGVESAHSLLQGLLEHNRAHARGWVADPVTQWDEEQAHADAFNRRALLWIFLGLVAAACVLGAFFALLPWMANV